MRVNYHLFSENLNNSGEEDGQGEASDWDK